MIQYHRRKVIYRHIEPFHTIKNSFLLAADKQIASPAESGVEAADTVEHLSAICGIATARETATSHTYHTPPLVFVGSDELPRVFRHPLRLFGLVYGIYSAAGSHSIGVSVEKLCDGAQVLSIDRCIVVDIDQNIAFCLFDTAITGVGEPLRRLAAYTEVYLRIVAPEASAFALGIVGGVVVYD